MDGLSNGEERRVVADAKTFEDLDEATRIESIMALPEAERTALLAHLIFENHRETAETHREIAELRSTRSMMTIGAHILTGTLAALLGLFGQPYTPTR